MTTSTNVDEPEWEVPDFALDNRDLRRAIRRGILRTAFMGAIYIVVGAVVLSIALQFILAGLGRQDQLRRIATGWQVAHPEFLADVSGSGPTTFGRSLSLDARLLTAPPDPATVSVRLSQNLLGHVGVSTQVTDSPAADLLRTIGQVQASPPKARERRQLRALPKSTVVSAVIEFTNPMDESELAAWLADHQDLHQMSFMEAVYLMSSTNPTKTVVWNGVLQAPVYGWTFRDVELRTGSFSGSVQSSFRDWVGELHDSDSDNLHRVGIDLNRLRAAAEAGLVHGMIVSGLHPAELIDLLDSPAVRTVRSYQIAFAPIS